jgi:hypothetical protein
LGGNLYPAVGMEADGNGSFDLEICIDCVMFHANGELPEEEEEVSP